MKIIPIKVWRLGYFLFGKWWPESYKSKISKAFRNFWGGRIVKKCGINVNFEKGANFSCDCIIGDNSGIGIRCEISGPVFIGNDVMMGPEVVIYTTNHEHSSCDIPMRLQGITERKEVIIEDDVWIGRRAIILPGVRIGKGSIVGAGAVVSKTIPPYSIAVGNPARVVKNRKEINESLN